MMVVTNIGGGTGWVYSSYIITNAHVVDPEGHTIEWIRAKNWWLDVTMEVVGVDHVADVAVLRPVPVVGHANVWPPSLIVDARYPSQGEYAFIYGYPLLEGPQASQGIVKAVSTEWLDLSAQIAPGSSGSPVLSEQGYVIGMVARYRNPVIGDGWAKAIPAPTVLEAFWNIIEETTPR